MKKDDEALRLKTFMYSGWIDRCQAYTLAHEWQCLGELLKLDIG